GRDTEGRRSLIPFRPGRWRRYRVRVVVLREPAVSHHRVEHGPHVRRHVPHRRISCSAALERALQGVGHWIPAQRLAVGLEATVEVVVARHLGRPLLECWLTGSGGGWRRNAAAEPNLVSSTGTGEDLELDVQVVL